MSDNPYELEAEDGSIERRGWKEAGITTAMIMKFVAGHHLSVRLLWGEIAVTSFSPGPEANTSICLYVWGGSRVYNQ